MPLGDNMRKLTEKSAVDGVEGKVREPGREGSGRLYLAGNMIPRYVHQVVFLLSSTDFDLVRHQLLPLGNDFTLKRIVVLRQPWFMF